MTNTIAMKHIKKFAMKTHLKNIYHIYYSYISTENLTRFSENQKKCMWISIQLISRWNSASTRKSSFEDAPHQPNTELKRKTSHRKYERNSGSVDRSRKYATEKKNRIRRTIQQFKMHDIARICIAFIPRV